MKYLKWIIPLAVVVLLAASVLGFLAGKDISSGTCLIADNGSCILVVGSEPIRLSDRSANDKMLDKFETGDKLMVLHSLVQETYPASAGAYICVKTGEGSIADIPDVVIQGLTELGWLK